MREFRMSKTTKEHYSSFEEMRHAWGLKPVVMKTKDENKLESQKQTFVNKHRCRACGKPMVFVGNSNTMVCSNENCKGIKHTRTDSEGNEIVTYAPSYDLLDALGMEIGNNLFS
jgi:ribosome-binding ATPase YchF (GTP1/OBG family)